MRPWNELPAVYLCRDIVDFRKGINGLAILVEQTLRRDPFSESCLCSATASAKRSRSCTGSATVFACGRSAWSGRASNGPARLIMR